MTAVARRPDDPTLLAPASPLRSDRGRTTIAPGVVEKIAARVARDDPEVEQVVAGGLGRFLPFGSATAGSDAAVEGPVAAVTLRLSLRYPAPVFSVAERVREAVAQRITQLTGLRVSAVHVTVAELLSEADRPRARVE